MDKTENKKNLNMSSNHLPEHKTRKLLLLFLSLSLSLS